MDGLNRVAAFVTQFVTPIYVLRAPIIAVIVSSFLLAVPDQPLEIYRALALDRARFWPQIVLAYVTLVIAGLFIWHLGRALTLRWQHEQIGQRSVTGFLLRWLPRLIGAVPLLAGAIGQFRAGQLLTPIEVPSWVEAQMPAMLGTIEAARDEYALTRQLLLMGAGISVLLGVLLVALTFLGGRGKKLSSYDGSNPWLYGLPIRLFFYALTIGLILAFSAYFLGDPSKYGLLANQLGTFAIFNLFMICFAFYLSVLTNIYDRTHFPALSLLLLVGVVATAFDLNDNHEIRTLQSAFKPLPSSVQAFKAWLAARPDREFFKQRGEPYPVYIVAAEGGGLYAAQHTALTLGRMQDRCPAFAQHIFAISAVSGGGLGSAVFASLAKEKAAPVKEPTCAFGEQPTGYFESRANSFLGRDFIAPLAAAGFFPDFLQRILPVAIPQFDRARALEAAFERAWSESVPEVPENPFTQSYYDHWKPDGVVPALVLNATHVKTGVRVAISPFRFYKQTTVRLATLNSTIRADIPLSTAVGISARFPWILPPASWRRGPEQYRFVDGGYFEASGIDTAHDLVTLLEDFIADQNAAGAGLNVKINLIVLSTDDILQDPTQTKNADKLRLERTARSGFDELTSPLEALLNTRWQRGVVSIGREFQKFCPDCIKDREDQRIYAGIDGDARLIRLNFTDFPLTLGWHLSQTTQTLISAHSGYADRCLAARASLRDKWPWVAQVFNENNCSACQMMYILTGRASALDSIAPSVTVASGKARAKGALPTWVGLCRAEPGAPAAPVYSLPKP